MRFAIIYRPKNSPPPEAMPEILKGMGEWMQKHGSSLEGVQFFVGGGGFATLETDDAAAMTQMITDNPFSIYSDIEIRPLVDPATAIGILTESYS